jgi:hypothetical protein
MENLKNIIKLKPNISKEPSHLYIASKRTPLIFHTTGHEFQVVAQALNTLLKQEQPKTFDCLWVEQHAGDLYKYISENIRTEVGAIDWDLITATLDKKFQKRWHGQKEKRGIPYENKKELDSILDKYRDKLYTLLTPMDEYDKVIRDRIFINLVRIAQKGNTLAQQQIIDWLTFIITEWSENSSHVAKWKGYTDDIEKRIQGCIRCYRYTGTFVGYVYKTLVYAARWLRPLYVCSLNDKVGKGTKTRIDYVIQKEDDPFDCTL